MLAPLLSMMFTLAQAQEPPSTPLFVSLRVTGQGKACRVAADGTSFRLPEDAVRLEERLRAFAARGAVAEFAHVDEKVAFRCVGHAIFLVERAGLTFSKIGLVAGPATDPIR
jgi:hypothetical protein